MTVVWSRGECCLEQAMAATYEDLGPFSVLVMYCGNCYTVHEAEVGGLTVKNEVKDGG